MNIIQYFNKLITPNSDYIDFQSYRRTVLINAILYATAFIFFFFTVVNYLAEVYLLSLIDMVAGIISTLALLDLRKNKILSRAANIATINLFIFFVIFVLTNQSTNFGLVWTLFFPLFAILIHGHKRGITFVVIFYAVIFPIAFNGIDIWENGPWSSQSFMRLFFASILMSYIIYFYELSQERSEKVLEEIRENEKEILEKLRISSHTDSLTELYNRRYFHDIIPKLMGMSHRNSTYFTFFILDLDFFKEYNDYYGHQAGDSALQDIAISLKHSIQRDDDFVFRLGGEEFGGIVMSKDREHIPELMHKVLHNIELLEIPHTKNESGHVVTASIGYTTLIINETTTIEEIYKKADIALYKAKSSGRNQAVELPF